MEIRGLAVPLARRPTRASLDVPKDVLAGSVEPGLPNQQQIGALLRNRETTGDELWRAQIPEGAQAPPALGPQGQLAVVTSAGVSLIAPDGKVLTNIEQTWNEVSCAPAFDAQGNVYVTGWSQPGVRSYTPTGEVRYKLGDLYGSDASPVIFGDTLSYAEGTGWLNTLNTSDGTRKGPAFEFSEGFMKSKVRSLDPAPDGSLVLVNEVGRILRVRNGQEEWRSSDLVRLETRPLQLGDDLVFCDKYGNLRRVDRQGKLVWGVSWRDNKKFATSDEQAQTTGFGTTPVLSPDGKTLYVAQRSLFGDGATPFSAFDLDGNHLWTKELPLPDAPRDHNVQVDKDGYLFVAGRYGGTVLCLDPAGETQWRFVNRSPGQLHFAVHGDVLHVATESGWVHALQRDALRKELERVGTEPRSTPTVVIQDGAVTVGGVRLKHRKP